MLAKVKTCVSCAITAWASQTCRDILEQCLGRRIRPCYGSAFDCLTNPPFSLDPTFVERIQQNIVEAVQKAVTEVLYDAIVRADKETEEEVERVASAK